MSYDAVVVGGGIVGASVAYHLVRDGAETLLVDREDDGRATAAGAGIVSPATSSRTDSDAWFRLAVEAADYYPELAGRLADEVGGEVGYDRPGLLSVATTPAEADALEGALERTRARQERLGHPEPGTVAELSPAAARERFPPLGDVERAFVYERAGRVDGSRFATALREAAVGRDLDVVRESAEEVLVEDGAVTGVRTEQETCATDAVVIAGGAWSAEWSEQFGVAVPVEPQRGQIAHLDAGATAEWPLVGGYRGHYLVPWPDGRVVAGATRETGSGFDGRATAGGVREVLDEALGLAPGLADATFREVRVGLRPASADGLPLLGAVPGVEGAYLATGHGPTGLTLGPYSGRVVAELIRGEGPHVDLGPFRPSRF